MAKNVAISDLAQANFFYYPASGGLTEHRSFFTIPVSVTETPNVMLSPLWLCPPQPWWPENYNKRSEPGGILA